MSISMSAPRFRRATIVLLTGSAVTAPCRSCAPDFALRQSLLSLLITFCLLASGTNAQVPTDVLNLNPQVLGLGADAAASWKLTDLTKRDFKIVSKSGVTPLTGQRSYGINAADFDGDGDLDIVVAFQSGGRRLSHDGTTAGKVYWLENVSGLPGLTLEYRVHLVDDRQLTPKDVVVWKSAGQQSVVVPCYLARETVLYQTSNGNQWNKVRLPSAGLDAPVRAVVADIDHNGTDDIVVTSIAETGAAIAWFRRRPGESSSWQAVSMGVTLPPLVGLDAGDVDSDGDLDLVCASEHSPAPHLLINVDGKGTDWRMEALQTQSGHKVRDWVARFSNEPVSQNHVKLVDIDQDGDLDCVETSLKCGYVGWRENVGASGPWTFHAIAGNLTGAYCFDVGDVDLDGRADIVVPSGTRGVYVFRNRGDGTRWDATRLGQDGSLNWANIVRLADLDADGLVDILATDWGKKAVVWRNPSGRAAEPGR